MTAMRDPVIYRYKEPSTVPNGTVPNGTMPNGTMWYPTYDFSHPIVDLLEGITHSYCTREFFIRRELYYWIITEFRKYYAGIDLPASDPTVFEFNRLKLEGVKLSKRHILQQIQNGEVSGFDDPKLFTIAGLRNKGHSPEALLHFIRNYVDYVAGDGGVIQMHKFEHALREYYEGTAVRRFGIPADSTLKVRLIGDVSAVQRPDQPDSHSLDTDAGRTIKLGTDLLINRSDFQYDGNKKYKRLKGNGNRVYLKYGPIVSFVEYMPGSEGIVLQVHTEGKAPAAIQWLAEGDYTEIYEGGRKWLCEGDIMEQTIVQLEQCGYYRVRDGKLWHLLDLKSSYRGTENDYS